MTQQTFTRDRQPTGLPATMPVGSATGSATGPSTGDSTGAGHRDRRVARLSWRSVGPDLAYLTSGFFLSLFSFVLLLTLFVLGVSTAVLWIGLPILGFALLTASWFARENRELLRRWGDPVAEPVHRWSSRRRVLSMLLDAQAWRELLHGTLITLPLRIFTFVVPVSWLAAGLGGVTWFIWGVFLPRDDYNGVAWLLVHGAGLDLGSNRYLAEAGTMFVSGVILLLLAPVVTRLCALADASVARILIGGHWSAAGDGSDR
ncbi:sensor domain-containing protein [Ornithinimicrobium faecis]|uniref:Sensor domain-containing protein n=1 Tax=Ornithinimicrobium faecis TaxID=2934158 RepID=A0ABY4YTS7_9MICO|nr:sensor domain-containing protein [Ornithinimicrobium sp. HY1793]USQ79982.1 sensor domain-containing protein [Ornithinimicrobium sp. HY1793]